MLTTVLRFLKLMGVLTLLTVLSTTCLAQTASEASIPAPRTQEYDWMSVADWYALHKKYIARAQQGNVDVLFLGDSITHGWTWGDNPQLFNRAFGQYLTANFAIGGDQTQNVLWRLQHGESGKLQPKLVVMMIGTNNLGTGGHTPTEVAGGVKTIIKDVQKRFNGAKILLMGILPFDQKATSPSRVKVAQLNYLLAQMNDDTHVFYFDFGPLFLDNRGNIPTLRMADSLHPTHLGYSLLAEKLQVAVTTLVHNE